MGDDVKIGAGSIVLNAIPPGCTVVGIPGRIVRRYGESTEDLDQVHLPDPVATELECLRRRIVMLEKKLNDQNRQIQEMQEKERGTKNENL